ncbi:cAMP-binding domain of CRP or a regulatory subunit of cAMP-dependent protein kinases [Chryseobacterium arachidis]|uniref:cAMP-binding domain of CRP or a regulatory subunit of cAMP-dependent protein kinases n=1 Tax=Chryseobacterium arachidis TaxID=1416778 RepID=A0A1M5KCS7_9FLAO|nr:Crp/Fnr family transcriptional regulator [Chryseobacterium arachidis]SHG50299.1 cAMP-binding domain of CRP or a regulatory subunit of cAMP-dependent protein kinases [Chryseobacterium arachidis]
MEDFVEIYLKSLQSFCPELKDQELDLFASKLNFLELKKKDIFLESGKVQKMLGFIAKGLVRSFYIDRHGNEITVGFYAEQDYATHYPAFVFQKPSHYTIQCLEPTTFACLSYDDIQSMYQQSHNIEKYGRLVAEEILIRQQERIESFIFQSAEERYLHFIKHHPGIFNRISLSHLCSFLGIERQTLTRIRQKLAHK